MAAGRPIIYQGCENGEIARMIHENHIGEVVGEGCASELIHSIMKYFKNRELGVNDGYRARQIAESTASSSVAVDSYIEILKKVCGSL